MLGGVSGRVAALVAALAVVVCAPGCTSSSEKREKPESSPAAPYRGNRGYDLPDDPFTREGTVVTATCSMGARYAGVNVEAWDAERWELRGTRNFFIPVDAAFSNVSGVKEVNSPLVELCGVSQYSPSPYEVDDLEYVTPRVRALFDLAFTRMAVVLRDPDDTRTSHVGYVESGGNADDFVRLGEGAGADEQNAVMSPDGRAVWFTYRTAEGEYRIGSRPAEGDHRLSDEGPASGHELPLAVSGKPAVAVQANMVRLAPSGRRLTATVPKLFGHVFDTLGSSGTLTARSARSAVLLSGCLGIVGWVDDKRVLCRNKAGSFRTVDARSGRPEGATVAVVREEEGLAAQGMVVSPDGEKFIAAVHLPNDRSGDRGGSTDFRVVSTSGEGPATPVFRQGLSNNSVFVEWW